MKRYFIIYKPYLVLSQFTSENGHKTLADFFSVPKDIYPVGRLDYDSEGLLILTNDKSLNYRLLHPSFQHEREYWIQVDGAINDDAILQLQRGVDITIDGKIYHTKKSIISRLRDDVSVPLRDPPIRFRKEIPAPWISMILTEGKNRQVRKMTAKVGHPTLRLIRQRIVNISLETMKPGEMIELDEKTVYNKLGLME